MMANRNLRFDPYLDAVTSEKLKSMVRLWGGNQKMRKEECTAVICKGLSDPNTIKAVLAALTPIEHIALALAKPMGGAIETGALGVGLRASGVPLLKSNSESSSDALVEQLIRRGLFLSNYSYDPGYLSDSSGRGVVFTDERLLASVTPPECEPLPIKPATTPTASTFRRPQAVVLDLISILQAIANLEGLSLTQSGSVRVNDLRKLTKAMKWKEDKLIVDGMPFPNPTLAFANAFYYSGLLSLQNQTLSLKDPIEQLATRPYAEQVSLLLWGFIQVREWQEGQISSWFYPERFVQGRLALTVALTALPVDTDGFFAINDLDRVLYERIGEHFSLGFLSKRPYYYNKKPEEVQKAESERLAKLRQDWLNRERQWISQALSTWLYYLGIVELGIEGGIPVSFRLTELGRAVLHPQLDVAIAAPASSQHQPAWIVQPNFEVMVYLESTTPEQLAFLERHAERGTVQQHTAVYRLTRESVYRGLESGTSLDDLLAGLQTGSGVQVPQNVQVDIRAWGALREQITLRRRTQLLEFPDESERQKALSKGLVQGIPVGDRFLLLTSLQEPPKRWLQERIDYAKALPKCLSVNEEGVIQLMTTPDLLLPSQLDQWAERMSDGSWRLTQDKVQAAIKSGALFEELLNLLQTRVTHSLPALLVVALKAWTGRLPAVEMATVTVLRCSQPEVFKAIAKSEKFKPYLLGQLAPDVLLVDSQQIKVLKKQLAWVGLRVSDELIVSH